jgi:hypothetical protein
MGTVRGVRQVEQHLEESRPGARRNTGNWKSKN